MRYKISIRYGNLLNEKTDFIVNASNTKLLLGSGVSMAFKRHCGIELQKEMDGVMASLEQPLQAGDVVATSSGHATNFSYALHAVIIDYNNNISSKYPTITTIKLTLENIEQYLLWFFQKKKVVPKIALPLLGCGIGGLAKIEVLQLYAEFFAREINFDSEVVIYGHVEEDFMLLQSIFDLY